MKSIKTIGGDFPKQTSHVTWGKWQLRDKGWSYFDYLPRAAVSALEKISEDGKGLTYKVTLKDGKSLIASSDRKTYDYLYVQMTAGSKSGDQVVITQGRKPLYAQIIVWGGLFFFLWLNGPNEPAKKNPTHAIRLAPMVSSFSSASCCELIGMGTACGLGTSYLAQACGQRIDSATAYGSADRGARTSGCMNEAARHATDNYSSSECNAIEKRIYQMTGGSP